MLHLVLDQRACTQVGPLVGLSVGRSVMFQCKFVRLLTCVHMLCLEKDGQMCVSGCQTKSLIFFLHVTHGQCQGVCCTNLQLV